MQSPQPVWLIAGASGVLGHELCGHLVASGRAVVGLHRTHPVSIPEVRALPAELADTAAIERLVAELKPTHVVHAAGMTNVDACEKDEAAALRANAATAATLARASARSGASFVYISTDHLWDGTRSFVTEDEPPCPLNAYARSKQAGERECATHHPRALIVRTNFFGRGRPWKVSFSDWVEQNLRAAREIQGFTDVFVTPIATALLAPLLTALVGLGKSGVFNLAGRERVSKYELARRTAQHLGLPASLVRNSTSATVPLAARRPQDMSLSTAKIAACLGRPMPSLDESLATLSPATAPAPT